MATCCGLRSTFTVNTHASSPCIGWKRCGTSRPACCRFLAWRFFNAQRNRYHALIQMLVLKLWMSLDPWLLSCQLLGVSRRFFSTSSARCILQKSPQKHDLYSFLTCSLTTTKHRSGRAAGCFWDWALGQSQSTTILLYFDCYYVDEYDAMRCDADEKGGLSL